MNRSPSQSANAGRSASGVRRVRAAGLSRGGAIALMSALALVVLVLDLVSKNWAEDALMDVESRPLLGDLLQLRLIYNSGAAWGMGEGITPIITCVQILICVAAILFVVRGVRSRVWVVALGLIIGGALGNIHDRLLREPAPFRGEVVDFLQLPHWPIFNIADIGVTTGAILIVLLGVLGTAPDPSAAGAAPADGAAEHEEPSA